MGILKSYNITVYKPSTDDDAAARWSIARSAAESSYAAAQQSMSEDSSVLWRRAEAAEGKAQADRAAADRAATQQQQDAPVGESVGATLWTRKEVGA